MNKIPFFVPYVNRPDMLARVINSVRTVDTLAPFVINNSGNPLEEQVEVLEAPVPLSFTQSQNWMMKIAAEEKSPFYLWAHCDAIFTKKQVQELCGMACEEWLKGTRWGAIFTNYDILCAYRTEASCSIGGYDTNFFDYSSDQDFYRRMRLSGYETMESHIAVGHDQGSSSLRADPFVSLRVSLQVEYRSRYYRAKWGGDAGKETFSTPFNEGNS